MHHGPVFSAWALSGRLVLLLDAIQVDMFFLRQFFTATAVAAFFGAAFAADPAAQQFDQIRSTGPEKALGRTVEVEVDLTGAPGLSEETQAGRLKVLYRMAFNQIAEGWSWRPLADPGLDDYYEYKFLPLQSVMDERGEYRNEDKIGAPQETRITWRYDYFLAFANLYDFYPRVVDDDAGFSADLPEKTAGQVGLRATARLIDPVVSESTTFWKAIHARPVDFTLKKRYLVGQLQTVSFVDLTDGHVLCTIHPGEHHCSGR